MPKKVLQELEQLCDADKRKSADEFTKQLNMKTRRNQGPL